MKNTRKYQSDADHPAGLDLIPQCTVYQLTERIGNKVYGGKGADLLGRKSTALDHLRRNRSQDIPRKINSKIRNGTHPAQQDGVKNLWLNFQKNTPFPRGILTHFHSYVNMKKRPDLGNPS